MFQMNLTMGMKSGYTNCDNEQDLQINKCIPNNEGTIESILKDLIGTVTESEPRSSKSLLGEHLDLYSRREVDGNGNLTEELEDEDDDEDQDEDEDEDSGIRGWTNKRPQLWDKVDVKHWIFWASTKLGMLYHDIPPELVIPGEELVRLSRDDFRRRSNRFGEKLYDLLPKVKVDKNSESAVKKRGRGRPPKLNSTPKPPRKRVENLWEFIRNLLMDRRYCPEVIRWVDYETKKFRFVDTHKVAKLWGARFNGEGNNAMTYAKFTRCIRYYYKQGNSEIIRSDKRRLVYQFGRKVTGLQTDNPNFVLKIEKNLMW